MRPLSIITTIVFVLIIGTPAHSAEQTCLEKLEKDCTSCHYNTRICKKIEKKSKRAWKSTVKRMLRYGMKMDKKEQSDIVDCLLELKKDSEQFCK